MGKQVRFLCVLALLLLGALLIVGCSGDSDDGNDSNSNTSSTTDNTSGTTEGDETDNDTSNNLERTVQEMQQEYFENMCRLMFECEEVPAFVGTLFGGTQDGCVAQMMEEANQPDDGDDDDTEDECLNPDLEAANECLNCWSNITCDELAEAFTPGGATSMDTLCPACNEVCPEDDK